MEAVKDPPWAHDAAELRPAWRRRLGVGIAVALVASALSVLLVELILRVQGYRVPVLLSDRVRAHYRIAPNAEFVYLGYLPGEVEDFANPVKLNALGFHDRDYPVERPTPGTYRVLVLGDSYVAAWEVPVADTFHKLLEARLLAEDPLRRASYEVIAFGQGRTAQETEIEWLRKYGTLYHPDMVLLLFFCGNDFMENDAATFAAASRFGNHYIKEIAPRKIRVYEKLLLFPSSRLNGLLADAAAEYYAEHLDRFVPGISREDLEDPEIGIYRNPLPPEWPEAFDRTGKLLNLMRRETEAIHARFFVAALSGPQSMGEVAERELWAEARDPRFDYQRPERWIREWAKHAEVPLVELGPPLAKIGRREVFWKHDQHLNPRGHAAVADLLYPALVEEAQRQ
jgi:lysophospholipase L1-like esterase